MVSVDHQKNIERIIDILSEDSTLKECVLDFKFGEDDYLVHDKETPYIIVSTQARSLITKDQFGIGEGSSDPQSIVNYVIRGYVQAQDSEATEKELYTVMKGVIDALRANPRLKKPSDSTDPLAIRSLIVDVSQPENTKGAENQNFTIVLQVQVGSEWTLTLTDGSSTVLDLLGKPSSPEGFDWDANYDDEQLRVVDATTEKGALNVQYENTPTTDAIVRGLLGTVGTITLTKNGVFARQIKIVYVEVIPSVDWDVIERSILHMEHTR
jgi:hypothetical protein